MPGHARSFTVIPEPYLHTRYLHYAIRSEYPQQHAQARQVNRTSCIGVVRFTRVRTHFSCVCESCTSQDNQNPPFPLYGLIVLPQSTHRDRDPFKYDGARWPRAHLSTHVPSPPILMGRKRTDIIIVIVINSTRQCSRPDTLYQYIPDEGPNTPSET